MAAADAKVTAAKTQIKNLSGAVELYFLDTGTYPSNSEGLGALLKPPAGQGSWAGPYIRSNKAIEDPWGKPYVYKKGDQSTSGRAFSIISLGSDGSPGGEGLGADILSD